MAAIHSEVVGSDSGGVVAESDRPPKPAAEKTAHLIGQMERHFSEAEVTEYENLIGATTNDPKDTLVPHQRLPIRVVRGRVLTTVTS
jgi:hypothetical protein